MDRINKINFDQIYVFMIQIFIITFMLTAINAPLKYQVPFDILFFNLTFAWVMTIIDYHRYKIIRFEYFMEKVIIISIIELIILYFTNTIRTLIL